MPTRHEPTTEFIDVLTEEVVSNCGREACAIVGIGGGTTLDIAKAVSNLLTNGGSAEDYQGWDLVKVPGIFKVGIPTLSGTGAEATRTCIMTNQDTGLKLGMNSDHTLEEVGQQFSVTRERIRQIEAKALRKLKHPSRSKQLKSFLDKS